MRTDKEVVARALSVAGKGCAYAIGAGGKDPSALFPWDGRFQIPDTPDPVTGAKRTKVVLKACDCSGFIAWALGVNRHIDPNLVPLWEKDNGNWFETTALVRDAERPLGAVNKVPWAKARPGMLFVYGDRIENGVRHQGHVGLITQIKDGAPSAVVHCSIGNFRHRGDAIRETSAEVFLKRGIVAEVMFVEYEGAA